MPVLDDVPYLASNSPVMSPMSSLLEAIHSRQQLLKDHPLYAQLKELHHVRTFSEGHVFAVWDFMSLLKTLQIGLTGYRIPWMPPASPQIARFINEIVQGEETDENDEGEVQSHFEMYLDAMRELGADTGPIETLLLKLGVGESLDVALNALPLHPGIAGFVQFTFSIIETGEMHRIASAFTFGREDLIPDMFLAILNKAEHDGQGAFGKMRYYLNRHIEVDGDHHGPLSLQMVTSLCGSDAVKWQEAEETAIRALDARIALWDALLERIQDTEQVGA